MTPTTILEATSELIKTAKRQHSISVTRLERIEAKLREAEEAQDGDT